MKWDGVEQGRRHQPPRSAGPPGGGVSMKNMVTTATMTLDGGAVNLIICPRL